MKFLKVIALGFVAYVVAAFILKLFKGGRTVTEAATQSIAEPVGFVGSALTIAFQPAKWNEAANISTTAAKAVATEPSYGNAQAAAGAWAEAFFGLASQTKPVESKLDENAKTLSEEQLPGTLAASPASYKGEVY